MLISLLILLTLAACAEGQPNGAAVPPRPALAVTPAPDDSAYQMYLDAIQAEGTLEAARARMTATEQVRQDTVTAAAEQRNATATERAWLSERETAAAQGTATAVAQQATLQAGAAISTATAQYQATQGTVALQMTRQALNYKATVEAASAASTATAQAAEAEIAKLTAERERMMNRIAAVTPWAVGLLVLTLAMLILIWWVRVELERRRVVRNKDNEPLWWLPDSRNPTIIVPERLTGPGASVQEGAIHTPPPAPGQMQVTTQAQIIEMLRSIPPEVSRGIPRRELIRQVAARMPQAAPRLPAGEIIDIQVVDDDDPEVHRWVADVEEQFTRNQLLRG